MYAVARLLIESTGQFVLMLPPYYCEMNPIKLVWGIMKGDVARNNTTYKMGDIKRLFLDAVAKVSPVWKKCVEEVHLEIQPKFWELDNLVERQVQLQFFL